MLEFTITKWSVIESSPLKQREIISPDRRNGENACTKRMHSIQLVIKKDKEIGIKSPNESVREITSPSKINKEIISG